jgi:tetratricopeptide (TPR) repeat protein
LIKLAGVLY